jgi:hypothetical protein
MISPSNKHCFFDWIGKQTCLQAKTPAQSDLPLYAGRFSATKQTRSRKKQSLMKNHIYGNNICPKTICHDYFGQQVGEIHNFL